MSQKKNPSELFEGENSSLRKTFNEATCPHNNVENNMSEDTCRDCGKVLVEPSEDKTINQCECFDKKHNECVDEWCACNHDVAEEKCTCDFPEEPGNHFFDCPLFSSPISESCVKEDIDILRKVGGKLKLPQIKNIQSLLTLIRTETVQENWFSPKEKLPALKTPVLAVMKHWHTGNFRYAVLEYVKADDHDWTMDGDEVSYDWNVIAWKELPTLESLKELLNK